MEMRAEYSARIGVKLFLCLISRRRFDAWLNRANGIVAFDAQVDRFEYPERMIHIFGAKISNAHILTDGKIEICRAGSQHDAVSILDQRSLINTVCHQLANLIYFQHVRIRVDAVHLREQPGTYHQRIRTIVSGIYQNLRRGHDIGKGITGILPIATLEDMTTFDGHDSFVTHFRDAVKDQVVLAIAAKCGSRRSDGRIQRKFVITTAFDVAPVDDEVFVNQRNDSAFASD